MASKSEIKRKSIQKTGKLPDFTIELEPCPFCGSQAILYDYSNNHISEFPYIVRCSEEIGCGVQTNVYRTAEEAIYKWNKRYHKDPKLNLIIEKLNEAPNADKLMDKMAEMFADTIEAQKGEL